MASSLLFLGVLVLSGATFSLETEVVVLRAVRGLPARLPCGQGRVFLDGPEAYVLWLKNDRDLLYRIERRLPSNCEGENCRDETALVIKRVSEQDGGIYRCRVHYQASPSVDYVIDVRLVGAPQHSVLGLPRPTTTGYPPKVVSPADKEGVPRCVCLFVVSTRELVFPNGYRFFDSPGTPRIVDENDDELTKGYVGPLAVGADLTLVCEVDEAVRTLPKTKTSYQLYAVNGTIIATYGYLNLHLDLGLRRDFEWRFILADVTKPIIGVDFLGHYNLLVDCRNQRLVDGITSLITPAHQHPGIDEINSVRTTMESTPYHQLLREYPDITRPAGKPGAPKHNVVHHIRTTPGQPVASHPRRLDPERLQIAKKEFDDMLLCGTARRSDSPWSSPLHLARKKDDGWRPCGDYRSLNARTIPDRYPVRHIQDFACQLAGKQVFSTIDLIKAYNQIRVFEDDIPKTAITTPFGLFEFPMMTFGLRNASQTFQRFIDEVLKDFEFCYGYVDDILVYSESADQHQQHLRALFQRLQDYGVLINTNKCVFGQPEVTFLGYSVSATGVKPLPEKVKAIQEYPVPKTVKELRRFLGMMNFYRRFLPGAAATQASLNALLSDETDTLVYWRRNGVAVERYAAGATRVVMRARNVTRDELDAHYECVAQNADVTEPLTASVVVKMYLPPLSVEVRLNHNVEFEAGQPRVVDCVVVGCVPPPSVTWHLGDNQLRPTVHKELHDGNYTVSSLTLAPSLRDNGNQLVCRAHNTELPDEVYDDKVTIHVGFRPVCLTTRAQVVGVAARQAETLTCVVEASPEPLSVSWTFENTRTLYTSVKKVPGHLNRYSSTLTWMGQDTDIGLLLCRATNSYGEQKQACVYSVSHGGPPEQPTCDIFRSYPSLLRVQCKKGWDGGRPQKIALEVYAGSGMLLHNLTDAAGYFEVNDIFESKNYSAVVYASSVRGRSQPVHLNLHSVTTHVASAVTEDTTASSFVMLGWLQIVIGSTILLVILIAATLCMRINQTRRLSMENNPDLVPRSDGRVYDCLRATTEVLGVALAVAASTVVNTLRADHYDCDFEDVIQVLDKQESPSLGSFHREPDFTQERVLGSTNITVNQLAACPNAYSGPPVPIRVMPGCTLHTTPKFCANEQQSYFSRRITLRVLSALSRDTKASFGGAEAWWGGVTGQPARAPHVRSTTLHDLKHCAVLFNMMTDYEQIKAGCLSRGELWEDPDFPATQSSVFYYQTPPFNFVWKRAKEIYPNTVFVQDNSDTFDVIPGKMGDRWLVSCLGVLYLSKGLFYRVVPADQRFEEPYTGVFRFRLWWCGQWVEVLVDDRLPTVNGRLAFLQTAHSNQMWPSLLEKAYANLLYPEYTDGSKRLVPSIEDQERAATAATSERDDRFIVSTSLRNRHLTGVDVQQELRRVRQVAVSEWTVRRRLKEANLTPKRPASGPKLTAGHRQARLQFAREHLDWSIAQWRSVLFTDECRVCLHGSDRRGRVYRRPGERFAQCCFAETVAYGGGSCMMWAGISLEGKTALVFVPGGGRGGGLTADRYITDILLGHVVPYAEFVGEDFVLMHDNARCHTARVSRQFLREKELRTMDWPALSPDLNPIEHLWDELKRRVRARNPVPASVDELKTALLEEWDGIPQETVKKLIRSMRNRLQA
ncbi:unnamed protein product, partial [Plutella xylostella]